MNVYVNGVVIGPSEVVVVNDKSSVSDQSILSSNKKGGISHLFIPILQSIYLDYLV